MTLEELYGLVGGNYEQAVRIMRKDKLIDRYVRKFADNDICDALMAAGKQMDATGLYENAHALKGLCSNLGFDALASAASEICEEFRPGNERTFTNDELTAKLGELDERYRQTIACIKQYIGE